MVSKRKAAKEFSQFKNLSVLPHLIGKLFAAQDVEVQVLD